MNFNDIQELIKLINKSSLTEFKMKDKEFEILIRTKKYYKGRNQTIVSAPQMATQMAPVIQQAPNQTSAAPVVSASAENQEKAAPVQAPAGKNTLEIKSPIVGTFYRSAGPDKPLFAKVGDQVKQGDVVCIIEAMKLFNEIESEISGTIVKVLVEDASPVEYDQVLFLVEV